MLGLGLCAAGGIPLVSPLRDDVLAVGFVAAATSRFVFPLNSFFIL